MVDARVKIEDTSSVIVVDSVHEGHFGQRFIVRTMATLGGQVLSSQILRLVDPTAGAFTEFGGETNSQQVIDQMHRQDNGRRSKAHIQKAMEQAQRRKHEQ